MKRRIKDIPISSNELYNEFYNMYQKHINWLFGERKEETVYIEDIETVKKVNDLLDDVNSNIIYLVGSCGIGKTTLLKKEYGLVDNAVTFNEKRKMVFVSMSFRGQLLEKDIKRFIANTISNLCDVLEKKFEFDQEFYTISGQLDFYDYINCTMGSLLGYVKKTELIGKKESEAKILKLDRAEENDPYTYEACRLKYYLYKLCEKYKKLILVVDNIEVLKCDRQKLIIRNMLALFSCLLNVPEAAKKTIPTNIIFSIREKTYMRIMNEEEIEAYRPFVVVIQKRPVDIIKYIKMKNDEARYESEKDIELGKDAYEIIMNFSKKFNSKYSIMITNLSNYDFQTIKKMYKRIFMNKIWVMRGNRRRDFLNLSKTEYLFNNISVIRALACGNNAVYRGKKSKIIPNIFLNDEVNDDSLVCMLILRYIVKSDLEVRKKQILYIFKSVFNNKKIMDSVSRTLEHFLEYDILIETERKQELYLKVTPRGKELWEMFSSDSVLLEMYREDHFLDDINRNISFISSYDLMSEMGQYEIFNQLFCYLEILLKLEKKLHILAYQNGKFKEYQEYFGGASQIKRLLEGVIKSIEYSGNMKANGVENGIDYLREQIRNIDQW